MHNADPLRPGRRAFWLGAVLLAVGLEAIAALSGADASWDLRNYHLYAPWALLHKPFGTDVAPAHVQTFLPPTLDLLYAGLARSIPYTALLNVVLALPQAAAVVLALALAWRLTRPANAAEAACLVVLTAIAGTGTAALSTIALSMSESLPVLAVMAAWLVLVRPALDALPSPARLLAAGALVGAACGLKLTLSFAALALLAVLPILPWPSWRTRLSAPVLFGVGLFAGAAALSGYWWVIEWQRYGNPLFPFGNHIFHSPFARPESFRDETFLPRSFIEAVSAPWSWAVRLSWATGESRLRDPRFAVAIVAALLALARYLVVRPRLPWPFLALPAWFVLGFALWRVEFSIGRYLSVLEIPSGAVMAAIAIPLCRNRRVPLLVGSFALAAACAVVTVYPRLARTPPGLAPPLAVDLGPLPPDSTVLLLDNEPMGYLATFADPRIRFVATNDFFMSLDGSNPLQREVEHAIASRTGPLYGLWAPSQRDDRAAATLSHYHLTRGPCRPVATNLSPDDTELCQLDRRD